MSLSQRLKDEEKRKRDEARAREKRLEELLLTHSVKLQSRQLIPIVGSFLKEMTKSLNLILESEPAPRDNPYYLHNYNIYTKDPNSWFFFPKKGFLLFSIVIGAIVLKENQTTKEWEAENVYPIEILHHDWYPAATHSLEKYFIPLEGINGEEIEKWLENAFFKHRSLLPKP